MTLPTDIAHEPETRSITQCLLCADHAAGFCLSAQRTKMTAEQVRQFADDEKPCPIFRARG